MLFRLHAYGQLCYALILVTLIVRCATLPLTVMQLKTSAHMHNHMPTLMSIQQQMVQAKNSGDLGQRQYISSFITVDYIMLYIILLLQSKLYCIQLFFYCHHNSRLPIKLRPFPFLSDQTTQSISIFSLFLPAILSMSISFHISLHSMFIY